MCGFRVLAGARGEGECCVGLGCMRMRGWRVSVVWV